MDVKLFKPKSELLKKYIVGFCFVNKGDEKKEYIIYPNNYTSLSISTGAVIHFREGVLGVSSIEEGPTTVAYVSQYNTPIRISYSSAPVDQLVFFFKPYGINHFVNNISEYMPEVLTTQFSPFKDLEPTLACVFSLDNRTTQLEIIELYLLSIFQLKKDPFFYKVLQELDKGVSKFEIAIRTDVSLSYLEDYFKHLLGKSIEEYIEIENRRELLKTTTIKTDELDLCFFDDLFIRESELLSQMESCDSLDFLFSNLDFSPQRYWFVL